MSDLKYHEGTPESAQFSAALDDAVRPFYGVLDSQIVLAIVSNLLGNLVGRALSVGARREDVKLLIESNLALGIADYTQTASDAKPAKGNA